MNECVQPDKPQQFCKNVPPFFRPQLKLAGSYRLPLWDLSVSTWGTYAEYQKKTDREIPVFKLTALE